MQLQEALSSSNLRLFELAQSAMRMRGLGPLNQRVEIVVVRDHYDVMANLLRTHLHVEVARRDGLRLAHGTGVDEPVMRLRRY